MNGFSADRLALREPFDLAARARAAASLDLRGMAARLRPDAGSLNVVDLACGTGANLRALAPQLGGAQRWLLVDHDPGLLAALPAVFAEWSRRQGISLRTDAGCLRIEGPDWNADVRWCLADLSSALDKVPFAGTQLVTAAALLDLVSEPWLEALIGKARSANAAMFFALSVDGRTDLHPAVPGDDDIHRWFAAHQKRDKGFGPALGGDAPRVAAACLEAAGYGVVQARSDWVIDDVAMLRAMVEGVADAALAQSPDARALVEAWRTQRLASAPGGRMGVGHLDLLALPRS